MVMRRVAVIAMATGCLLFAQDESGQKIRITTTERMDFPAGGVLHVKGSIGELSVEGWDEPVMELTTTKSPPLRYGSNGSEKAYHGRELEEVRVTAARHDGEIVVTTTLPHRRSFPPPSPLRGASGVQLDYQIKIPREARLLIEHEGGEVLIEGLTGDIHVTTIRGEIVLQLPEDRQYAIDAKSDFGNVVSDFPGRERRRRWLLGHRFVPDEKSAGKELYLRAGFGDIIIQRIRKPPTSSPVVDQ